MVCLQDKFPSTIAVIFHWTMILGERLVQASYDVTHPYIEHTSSAIPRSRTGKESLYGLLVKGVFQRWDTMPVSLLQKRTFGYIKGQPTFEKHPESSDISDGEQNVKHSDPQNCEYHSLN